MYKELKHTLSLRGTGESKERAFNDVFSQIKPLVAKTFSNIVLQIEPQEVEVVSAIETSYTEKFLGILFPRKRIRYDIAVNITVRLRMIDMTEIQFEKRNEELSTVQRVLRMQ
ncbi:DUF4312 family protein [Pelosinus sp. UFO1]|uniref:DUF4312 family protein n=1 Tax=Pelosinus sp. UFO1 TaxID=484770 RepID=UPI0004D0DC65|nr:DUF4312 family protein [Pelosinus sp. UFO1]AIF52751.1 Conserved hypothetical protein CHP03578 [Pelosinus sp. UFO1]